MPGLACRGQAVRRLLDEAELAELETVLEAGPLAAGWTDQRWTLARVRDLVAGKFGVAYTVPGIWYLLPPRLVMPDGRPPRHRAQRRRHRGVEEGDLAAGQRIGGGLCGWIVFEDETGQSLRPPLSRTSARRGITLIRVRGGGTGHVWSRPGLLPVRRAEPPDVPLQLYRARKGETKMFT